MRPPGYPPLHARDIPIKESASDPIFNISGTPCPHARELHGPPPMPFKEF